MDFEDLGFVKQLHSQQKEQLTRVSMYCNRNHLITIRWYLRTVEGNLWLYFG